MDTIQTNKLMFCPVLKLFIDFTFVIFVADLIPLFIECLGYWSNLPPIDIFHDIFTIPFSSCFIKNTFVYIKTTFHSNLSKFLPYYVYQNRSLRSMNTCPFPNNEPTKTSRINIYCICYAVQGRVPMT